MRPISTALLGLAFLGLTGAARAQQEAARFREMFLQIDVNGDTVLDRDEVPEAGRAAFDRLLKRGDANKNGKLEADEARDLGKKLNAAAGDAGAMAAGRLKAMDKDGDGKVARAEFTGIAANFDRIDDDKDGQLTREEFAAYAKAQRPNLAKPKAKAKAKAAAKEEAKPAAKADAEAPKADPKPAVPEAAGPLKRFKAMDKDGDGKLSKGEFPRAKMFDRLDANADGFLTTAELAKIKKS